MNKAWKTVAIGRHLVDVPADARLISRWVMNESDFKPLAIRNAAELEAVLIQRESEIKGLGRHEKHGSMFVRRENHSHGAATLVSWKSSRSDNYRFDTYFVAGTSAIYYPTEFVSSDRLEIALNLRNEFSNSWHELEPGKVPAGMGFVVGDVMIAEGCFNPEHWSLVIKLAGKPDVSLEVSAFAVRKVGETLRQRAGGIVTGMLGLSLGLVRLRNRERPVGPIWAEELLVAGTQDGKRGYGFKWEAPGKARSLAEPQINVELEVGESAYKTNAESFASDDEALALWDRLVESIRLRPGAV